MTRKHVDLFEQKGPTAVSIRAYLTADGDVVVEGYDVGDAPSRFWGDSDYEYLVHVRSDHKDALLRALIHASGACGTALPDTADARDERILTLLARRFGGDAGAVGAFRSFCTEHGVPAEFSSWI